MSAFYLINSNQLSSEAEKREMQSIYDAVTSQINNQAMSAQAMSAMIASHLLKKPLLEVTESCLANNCYRFFIP